MTGEVRAAGWAVLGKLPGDKNDYRVLLGGAEPGVAERGWAGVPSTPQLGAVSGPGRLPWVTFRPGGSGAGRWLAVAAVDTTQDRDAVGRPITETRYVEVPFAKIAGLGTGYQALYQAVPPVGELAELARADPVTLDLGRPKGASLVAQALGDPECYENAARMASLLLDGGLVITLADQRPLPLAERLAQFDRVMGLLPFGLRASISLASWQDGTRAAFHLAFGKFPTRGKAVAEHGGTVPAPIGDRAASYLAILREARDRFGVERVIEHLAGHRAPLVPAGATAGTGAPTLPEAVRAEASEILASLTHPALVIELIRKGGVPSVERVANAWPSATAALDGESLDELEAYLLGRADAQAERAVHANWSGRSARVAGRLALDGLAGGSGQDARRLHGYAIDHGQGDQFLATLASGRGLRGGDIAPQAVAHVLRELVRPVPGHLPQLRDAVLAEPELARWLLRLPLRGTGGRVEGQGWLDWLGWLDPEAGDAPTWLRRYRVLAVAHGTTIAIPPRTPELEAPRDVGADEAEDLALIAACILREGSFARLADEWWPALLSVARGGQQGRGDPGRAELADFLKSSGGPARDLATAVRLDTLRIRLGQPPRHYPFGQGVPACLEYLDALWALWTASPTDVDVPELTVRLLRLPKGVDPLSEAAVTLLRAVVADDRVPVTEAVVGAIADVLALASALADDPRLPVDWWARVERLRPDLRTQAGRLRAAVRRAQAGPGAADQVEIAILCARAVISGCGADEVAAIAGPWLASLSPAVRTATFDIIDSVLRLDSAENHRSYDDQSAALAAHLAERRPPRP
jgi:hypothetical protein